MEHRDETIVVGMSGGVDSSVAAALLNRQGYRVLGVMLKLWNEPGREDENRCCAPEAMARARRVAAQIGIPFYVIDVKDLFRNTVVQYFIDQYQAGNTPNPCLVCNREIRWGFLLEQARSMGANYLATGHYARLEKQEDGSTRLLKSLDTAKDQSYVLAGLNQEQLASTMLPLGELTKGEVREMARSFGFKVADQPDSQDLCFIGNSSYRDFLARNTEDASLPGEIASTSGEILGRHAGLSGYTIGQRKGLRIASAHPLYVLEKDMQQNRLIVGGADDLGKRSLSTGNVNWISGDCPIRPFNGTVKVRYRAPESPGLITPIDGGKVHIEFDQPQRDITPGQAAVIYNDDYCLGSGLIAIAQ